MTDVKKLITDHIDVWTSAIEKKSTTGRGSKKKISLHGIKKLRELILELAICGMLVPQDANDGQVSILLKKIEKEKTQLIREGKIKKSINFKTINRDEQPFELPAGWVFKRFGELLDFSGGSQPPKSMFSDEPLDGYVQLIQIRDLGQRPQPVYVPKKLVSKFCTTDDVMIGRYGASVGKVFWGKNGAYNVALIKLFNNYNAYTNSFLYLLMKSPLGQNYFCNLSRSAQAGFNKKDIECNVIPLVPLLEQQRIVSKADELMGLCDQLELQTENSIFAHQTLVETLLSTLTNSTCAEELQKNWSRIENHFDTLFTTENSVDQLKKTILQLAIMGKLVPQNPTDEPASVLLKKIAKEKERLIKEGEIKKQKSLPIIEDKEKPFSLQDGWEWTRLGEISLNSEAGWSPKCLPFPREGKNWGVLKVSAVTWGKFKPEENKQLPEQLKPKIECEVMAGDFLISRANTAELVARAVVVPTPAPKYLMMSDKIIRFIFTKKIDSKFINLINSSDYARTYYSVVAGGTSSSMKNVSREQIRNLLIALPPYLEQQRINIEVSRLLKICDELKYLITESKKINVEFSNAIVHQVIN